MGPVPEVVVGGLPELPVGVGGDEGPVDKGKVLVI